MRSDGGRRRLTGIMATVVVLVLVLAGGAYLWAQRNEDRLVDRNLRELARIGRGVEGQVRNLHSVMESLARADTSAAALIPDLTLDGTGVAGPSALADATNSTDAPRRGCDADGGRVTALWLSDGLGGLQLCYRGGIGSTPNSLIRARWDLAGLRPRLDADYFELTLLARDSGTVLLEASEDGGVRVHDVGALLDSVNVGSHESGALTATAAGAVTRIGRATVAGRSYRVFVQPLRIPTRFVDGAEVGEPERWLLAGIVAERRLVEEQLHIGPGVVLLLGLLLAAGVLSGPFVRTASMGPRERLRVRHLLSVVVALILGSGGLGIALADGGYQGGLRSEVFSSVDDLASALRDSFRAEVDAARSQLWRWTPAVRPGIAALGEPEGACAPTVPGPASDSSAAEASSETVELVRTGVPYSETTRYPWLTMAFWTDGRGCQVAKWTPRERSTTLVDVGRRDYYRAIVEDRGWRYRPGGPQFFIQSLRTWTTGEKSVAISTDASGWAQGGAEAASEWTYVESVGVVITELASLDDPVLPPGVSFALVDTTGFVLVHALDERSQEENLVEETGGNPVLLSTLTARTERALDADYRGRRVRLFVRTVPDTPLALVVILDYAQLDTVHFEAVFASTALFGGLSLILVGIFTLIEMVVPRKMHWVWPDPEHAGKYLALLVVLAMYTGVLLLPALSPTLVGIRLSYLLVPLFGVGLGLVLLSVTPSPGRAMRRARVLGVTLTLAAGVATLGPVVFAGESAFSTPTQGFAVLVMVLAVTGVAALIVHLERVAEMGPAPARLPPPEEPHDGGEGGSPARAPITSPSLHDRMVRWWLGLRGGVAKRRRAVRLYVSSMVLGLVLVGVLPGYLLQQLNHYHEVDLLARHHQVTVAEALAARRLRHEERVREHGLDREFRRTLDERPFDLHFGHMPFSLCRAGRDASCSERAESHGRRPDWRRALDEVVPFLGGTSVAMRELSGERSERVWRWARGPRGGGPLLEQGGEALLASLPVRRGPPPLWWPLVLVGGLVALTMCVLWVSRRIFLVDLWEARSPRLADVLKAVERAKPTADGGRRRAVAEEIHHGHLIVVCTRSTPREPLYAPREGWKVVDLMSPRVDTGVEPTFPETEDCRVLCLDHCDHRIREEPWGRTLLGFLETLLFASPPGLRVIVLTSQEPDSLLDRRGDAGRLREYTDRWARLLGHFTRVPVSDGWSEEMLEKALDEAAKKGERDDTKAIRVARGLVGRRADALRRLRGAARGKEASAAVEEGGAEEAAEVEKARARWADAQRELQALEREVAAATDERARARRVLVHECVRRPLVKIGAHLMRDSAGRGMAASEIVLRIREEAGTYYEALWTVLGREERIVVGQLASGAVVNPSLSGAIARLLGRGILVRKPELRIMNSSFEHFVRERAPDAVLREWERSGSTSTWELIRVPFLLGWMALALFLFWTQRDLLGNTITFLTTAGVGLAAIGRLVTTLQRGTPEGEKKGG